MHEQKKADSLQKIAGHERVENYLKKNEIKYLKSDSGVYVQMLAPGQGMQIDTGKKVTIKYNFLNFRGKVFDSNVDTSYHRPDTLSFKVGAGFLMKSIDNALKLLKEGSHAKMYLLQCLLLEEVHFGEPYGRTRTLFSKFG